MRSAVEECWILSENCSRWAEENRDDATRLAFRGHTAATAILCGLLQGMWRPSPGIPTRPSATAQASD